MAGQQDLLNLDYDTAKAALIEYLKSQDTLKSYNFSDTVMNEILNVLGVNTFKLMYYYNLVNSESWLDSAQLRSSVISHAKDLNYIPRSAKSSEAIVDIEIPTDGALTILSIPKGTLFSGRIGSQTFNFTTDTTSVYTSSNGTFNVEDLTIYEGTYINETYVVDYTIETQRFLITNKNADIDSVSVTVVEDGGSFIYDYIYYPSLLGVTPKTLSYFIQCNETEQYEIVFGNDLFGRKPKNGAVVQITYRTALGDIANGIETFELLTDVTEGHLSGLPTTSTVSISSSGAVAEDIESIRFMAPRHYETQDRAISESDYENLLRGQFPEIRSIAVFGGETLSPPIYGRVYISVDLDNIDGLPQSKKDQYTKFITPRCVMRPFFITPETLYYRVESIINYDVSKTTLSESDIKTIVTSAIASYNNDNLDDFKVNLRYSKFIKQIDDSHSSIESNETDIFLYKKISPVAGEAQNIDVDMVVPIYNKHQSVIASHLLSKDHSVYSTQFYYNGILSRIEDDSFGNLIIVNQVSSNDIFLKNIGSVDYATGKIKIIDFNPSSYSGSHIKIFIKPAEKDIEITGNNILTVEFDQIQLTVRPI
jgi:hypothetical protein